MSNIKTKLFETVSYYRANKRKDWWNFNFPDLKIIFLRWYFHRRILNLMKEFFDSIFEVILKRKENVHSKISPKSLFKTLKG